MRHRLEPRGGSRVEEWEWLDTEDEDVTCSMLQPVDSDGRHIDGADLLERCPRPATHGSRNHLIRMCDWHAKYYDRYIGPVKKG